MTPQKLFDLDLSARDRLRYVHDFLDLIYAEGLSGKRLQEQHWTWYLGVTLKQVLTSKPRAWKRIISRTADWPWPDLQQRQRQTVEAILATATRSRKPLSVCVPRVLTTYKGADGRKYFNYAPQLDIPLHYDNFAACELDAFLEDLQKLYLRTVRRCKECGHFFIRLRAGKSLYCSDTCRWRGFMAKKGYRPRFRRSAKPPLEKSEERKP